MTRLLPMLAAFICLWGALGHAPGLACAAAETRDADVCIYGGTSGGLVAAVQVARMGKRAVIVEPGRSGKRVIQRRPRSRSKAAAHSASGPVSGGCGSAV